MSMHSDMPFFRVLARLPPSEETTLFTADAAIPRIITFISLSPHIDFNMNKWTYCFMFFGPSRARVPISKARKWLYHLNWNRLLGVCWCVWMERRWRRCRNTDREVYNNGFVKLVGFQWRFRNAIDETILGNLVRLSKDITWYTYTPSTTKLVHT